VRQVSDKFVDRVSKLKAGDPKQDDTDLGPLINQRQTETFSKQVQRGIDEGAKVFLTVEIKEVAATGTP
jgi:aldehyde dehydrogenase (NAD+)